jgi:phage baseplate assembly protein gpV
MGRDSFAANGDIFIRITGGNLDVYAGYDGIDSNGNVFLDGGTVKVSGPSMGMEGAIDLDGALIINGGELITAGSVMNVSQDSEQPTILISYGSQQPAGSVISVKDAEGKTVLEYTSRIGFAMSGFTSPEFKQNEPYTLYIDGEKRTDITVSGAVTSLSDDGGVYNGGRSGGRGGWGGFGGQPGEGQPFPGGQRPDRGQGFPNESERPGAAPPPASNSNSGKSVDIPTVTKNKD